MALSFEAFYRELITRFFHPSSYFYFSISEHVESIPSSGRNTNQLLLFGSLMDKLIEADDPLEVLDSFSNEPGFIAMLSIMAKGATFFHTSRIDQDQMKIEIRKLAHKFLKCVFSVLENEENQTILKNILDLADKEAEAGLEVVEPPSEGPALAEPNISSGPEEGSRVSESEMEFASDQEEDTDVLTKGGFGTEFEEGGSITSNQHTSEATDITPESVDLQNVFRKKIETKMHTIQDAINKLAADTGDQQLWKTCLGLFDEVAEDAMLHGYDAFEEISCKARDFIAGLSSADTDFHIAVSLLDETHALLSDFVSASVEAPPRTEVEGILKKLVSPWEYMSRQQPASGPFDLTPIADGQSGLRQEELLPEAGETFENASVDLDSVQEQISREFSRELSELTEEVTEEIDEQELKSMTEELVEQSSEENSAKMAELSVETSEEIPADLWEQALEAFPQQTCEENPDPDAPVIPGGDPAELPGDALTTFDEAKGESLDEELEIPLEHEPQELNRSAVKLPGEDDEELLSLIKEVSREQEGLKSKQNESKTAESGIDINGGEDEETFDIPTPVPYPVSLADELSGFKEEGKLHFDLIDDALADLEDSAENQSALDDLELAADSLEKLAYKLDFEPLAEYPAEVHALVRDALEQKFVFSQVDLELLRQSFFIYREIRSEVQTKDSDLANMLTMIKGLRSRIKLNSGLDDYVEERNDSLKLV